MRENWVKIHVDLLDDLKLEMRPDCDFKLWVCLILLAKQTTEDGIIKRTSPGDLRRRFRMKCSSKKIGAGLRHFSDSGMISLDNDSIRILNYGKRQSVKDFHEKNAERQRKYYYAKNEPDVSNNVSHDVSADGQIRLEEIRSDQIPLKPPQGGATSHPFRSSRKAQAEPYVATCAGCAERGHNFRDCPQRVAILARQNES